MEMWMGQCVIGPDAIALLSRKFEAMQPAYEPGKLYVTGAVAQPRPRN